MEIILFRHGIAEEPGSRAVDGERRLTEKGKRKVRQAGKVLRHMLRNGPEVVIWTSPLVRAMETATILGEELGDPELEAKEWIAEGALFALEEAIASWPEEKVLLITGHAPDLDDWCHALAGADVRLGKGAAVGLRVKEGSLEGQLLWVIQGPAWKRFL